MNDPIGVQLRCATYHEAGHAVVGRMLGLCCGGVAIFVDGDDLGYAIMENPLYRWERGDGPRRKLAEAFCIALYAGAEAEGVFAPLDRAGDDQDRERATQVLTMVGVPGAEYVGDEVWERREALLRRKANTLVRRYSSKIERVAAVLLKIGSIESDAVEAIVNSEPGKPLLPNEQARPSPAAE